MFDLKRLPSDTLFYVGGNQGSFPVSNDCFYKFDITAPQAMVQECIEHNGYGRRTFSALAARFGLGPAGIRVVYFDNGSGVKLVSERILEILRACEVRGPIRIDCCQSHGHDDHWRFGIRENALLYQREFDLMIRFWSPNLRLWSSKKSWLAGDQCLTQLLLERSFPADMDDWPLSVKILGVIGTTKFEHKEFMLGEPLDLDDDITVQTCPLTHPGGCSGFRLQFPGKDDIAICTDCDLGPNAKSEHVALVNQAGVAYFDCQFSDSEYSGDVATPEGMKAPRGPVAGKSQGWGHSSTGFVLGAMGRCDRIPKKVVFGHHNPPDEDWHLGRKYEESRQRMEALGMLSDTELHFGRDGKTFFWL